MDAQLDIRLQVDRLLIAYLCRATGKSASSLAVGAGMAPTTLNRFLSKKIRLKSSLKDLTIRKLAERWGFDYLDLVTYRQKIEEALRDGKPAPAMVKNAKQSPGVAGAMRETEARPFVAPARDPLMDRIMGATYEVWFAAGAKQAVDFDALPGLVRLLYSRVRQEAKPVTSAQLKKRATDMLAAMALETGKQK